MDCSLPVFAYWHSADHTILADFLADWRPHFPQLRVIGDFDVEPLLGQILPEYLSLYRQIRVPAAKANIARLAYLHEHGGLYIDCHCSLLSASGVRELFGKLDSYELVLWKHSYVTVPRPRNGMGPTTSILLARPRSSIVRRLLLRCLANLAGYSKHQASHGLPDSNHWELCGAGLFSKVLVDPGSDDTHLKSEFEGRIYFSSLDDGPIAHYRHNVGQLWTIASYFNPMRYRRRFENFKHFKRALRSPLLVVELAFGEGFELSDSDADIMVQLEAESVLWQKERALNIALGHLPAHVEYVAWVDCDLVFSELEWPASAIEALQRFPLVQLFKNFVGLAPESTHQAGGFDYTGKSMAAFVQEGGPATATLPGGAWAAPRLLLERHGFYDALILGGGDEAFALAAYGKFGQLCRVAQLNEAQTRHYLQWARPFFAEVQGNVGYLSGDLFHYWHGDRANRLHSKRHQALRQFDFDPARDIEIDSRGCFRWSSNKPDLHAFAKNYWNLRREDG